jgi:RNA polymerase sigma factor (sigma-70 family)
VDAQGAFQTFFSEAEPRLRRALTAAYGAERGHDATAEAMAYAWEHWERLESMSNATGYLYRVAQSKMRERRQPSYFEIPDQGESPFEPKLIGALRDLSVKQRQAVVLVHGAGWTVREVAELTGTRPTSVHNHLTRGLKSLRKTLGVKDDR